MNLFFSTKFYPVPFVPMILGAPTPDVLSRYREISTSSGSGVSLANYLAA